MAQAKFRFQIQIEERCIL